MNLDTGPKSAPKSAELLRVAAKLIEIAETIERENGGPEWVDWKYLVKKGIEHTPMSAQRLIKKWAQESRCKTTYLGRRLAIPYAVYVRAMDKGE